MNTCTTSTCTTGVGTTAGQTSSNAQSGATAPVAAAVTFQPRCDVVQTDSHIIIAADLPGSRADDVDVQFERGVLTLRGRVRPRTPEGLSEDSVLLDEYGVGDFSRSFRIASAIDPAGISAEQRLGVLTIRLPRREAVQTRRIPVSG